MTTGSLAQRLSEQIERFLADAPHAVVVEDGHALFDFSSAHYSLAPDNDKCVLQIWSEERNIVRRVVSAESRAGVLKLAVMRFGQAKPSKLEFCADADRRTPSAKKAARATYLRLLTRMIDRDFSGWRLEKLTSAPALEHSFGPTVVRGLVRHGNSAFAIVGVNAQESQANVDGALSTGILWMDDCRERLAGKLHVEGLRMFLPAGRSAAVRMRMAHLNRSAAKWQLFELDEAVERIEEIDTSDTGNIATRLVHAPDLNAARSRFAASIEQIQQICPRVEVVIASAAEISFRLHGLEFARARVEPMPGSFRMGEQIFFGPGAAEIPLSDETMPIFRELWQRLWHERALRNRTETLYRIQPERWLESMVMRDVNALDERLDSHRVYSQVPAFSGGDRAMIDVLTVTREGRLAVIELKADEDLHLPLQGLDYWARVRWHHERGEFQKFGYFAGRELSSERPLLIMAAPSLHVHPTTDTLLRYLSPEIEWKLLGLDEHWRDGVRVIFRKHSREHGNAAEAGKP
ncbi:MAG TPA: hypothetical protein VN622_11660 [Clostridia bacterium]|nr:hypothetical protein [Clostridia bacterium]